MMLVALENSTLCATIDAGDIDIVSARKWYAHKAGSKIYARSAYDQSGKRAPVYMHRLILGTAAGNDTDHVNGDGLDNRKSNLRDVSRTINNLNRPDSRGCYFEARTGKWRSELRFMGTRIRLGRFPTEAEARAAYQAKRGEIIDGPHFELME